jgi:hypothetical protein
MPTIVPFHGARIVSIVEVGAQARWTATKDQ